MALNTQMQMHEEVEVVAKVDGHDVTRFAITRAFNKVCNKTHWKNPIDATVMVASPFERRLIEDAIMFFTGSIAQSEVVNNITSEGKPTGQMRVRFRAAGYYAAIGA